MINRLWWEVFPERLGRELNDLDKAGIIYYKDEHALKRGVLSLDLTMDGYGKLKAIFPDLYPYFRFEVYAPELELSHHQNPFRKNLCMIGRRTEYWHTTDTLASFLVERLPEVIKAGSSDKQGEIEKVEQHQAEPFSDYYTYPKNTGIIVDANWKISPYCKSGYFIIGAIMEQPEIQGAILKVMDDKRNILIEADKRIHNFFSKTHILGRWVRLTKPLGINNPTEIFNILSQKAPYESFADSTQIQTGKLQIRAAIFPEEISGWRKCDYGWLFACKFEY